MHIPLRISALGPLDDLCCLISLWAGVAVLLGHFRLLFVVVLLRQFVVVVVGVGVGVVAVAVVVVVVVGPVLRGKVVEAGKEGEFLIFLEDSVRLWWWEWKCEWL